MSKSKGILLLTSVTGAVFTYLTFAKNRENLQLREEIDDLKATGQKESKEKDDLTKTLNEVEEKFKEKHVEVEKILKERDELSQKLVEVIRNLESVEKQLDESGRKFRKQVESVRENHSQELLTLRKQHDEEVVALKNGYDIDLQHQKKGLREEMEVEKKQWMERKNADVQQIISKVLQQKEDVAQSKDTEDRLSKKVQVMEGEIVDLKKMITTLEREKVTLVSDLNHQRADQEIKAKELETTVELQEDGLIKSKSDMRVLQLELEKKNQEANEQSEELLKVSKMLKSTRDRLDVVVLENENLIKDIQSVNELKQKVVNLENEKEQLIERNRSSINQLLFDKDREITALQEKVRSGTDNTRKLLLEKEKRITELANENKTLLESRSRRRSLRKMGSRDANEILLEKEEELENAKMRMKVLEGHNKDYFAKIKNLMKQNKQVDNLKMEIAKLRRKSAPGGGGGGGGNEEELRRRMSVLKKQLEMEKKRNFKNEASMAEMKKGQIGGNKRVRVEEMARKLVMVEREKGQMEKKQTKEIEDLKRQVQKAKEDVKRREAVIRTLSMKSKYGNLQRQVIELEKARDEQKKSLEEIGKKYEKLKVENDVKLVEIAKLKKEKISSSRTKKKVAKKKKPAGSTPEMPPRAKKRQFYMSNREILENSKEDEDLEGLLDSYVTL